MLFALLLPAAFLVLVLGGAHGALVQLDAQMSSAALAAALDALTPGDVAELAPGLYDGVGLTLRAAGTANAPVVVRGGGSGDTRPLITSDTAQYQECFRFAPTARHVLLEGVRCTHRAGPQSTTTTQAGVLIDPGARDLVLHDLEIFSVTGIGVQAQAANDIRNVSLLRLHIHDTGTRTSDGNNGGQGVAFGGFTLGSAVTGVDSIVVRQCLVHECAGQEGDGIKLMYGVTASRVEDCVVYSAPRGVAQDENYGIAVYGGPAAAASSATMNVVLRNAVYGVFESGTRRNVGIYAAAGTAVEQNLVLDATQGIAVRLEGASSLANTRVLWNTVFGVRGPSTGGGPYAFSARGTGGAPASFVVANNVFDCGQVTSAAPCFGYRWPDGDPADPASVAANVYRGRDWQELSAGVMAPLLSAPEDTFVAPSINAAAADFAPAPAPGGAQLRGAAVAPPAAAPAASPTDFFLNTLPTPAGAGASLGAVQASAWALGYCMKPASLGSNGTAAAVCGEGPDPTVVLSAAPVHTPHLLALAVMC